MGMCGGSVLRVEEVCEAVNERSVEVECEEECGVVECGGGVWWWWNVVVECGGGGVWCWWGVVVVERGGGKWWLTLTRIFPGGIRTVLEDVR